MPKQRQHPWWEGALFYAGVQVAAWGLRALVRKARPPRRFPSTQALYRSQRLPRFAPPAAAFPVAWTINSVGAVAAGLHVLNLSSRREGRAAFLRLQAAAWAMFGAFNTVYFELDSPLNAAAVTVAFTLVTAASLRAAARMGDRRAIVLLLPTAGWLAVAVPLSLCVAAWNPDRFWGTQAWLSAPDWLRQPKPRIVLPSWPPLSGRGARSG